MTQMRIGRGNQELSRGLSELGVALDSAGVGPRGRFQSELVFEEMVTNVIRYGYDDEELHTVDVTVTVDGKDVVLVVSDDGKPFNPLDSTTPELPHSLAEAHVGGLGIMLVRKAAREMSYERRDGRNLLTVRIARD